MKNLIESIWRNEGFRPRPYQDHLGVWTFGVGFTYITEDESLYILRGRVNQLYTWLDPDISPLREAQQEVLVEMAYQLGYDGLKKFEKMWLAIQAGDCETAVKEMLDSKWASQTPSRANRLAIKFYDGGRDE